MKKSILFFSLLVSLIAAFFPVTANAQQPGNEYAIFHWQNNGDFNAFLNCDIDSITYSRKGLDGKIYSNVVVQEVWTPDSVYRIPINTIDSVAFRAPDPVLKDGIFHITEWHFPYVTDVNDSTALTISFNASIPSDSLPAVGQVVITDVYEGLLESGFAGRVILTIRTGNTVLVECEEVTLDDIYELLVCVGKSESFIDDDSPAGAPKRIRYEKEGVLSYEIARWNTKIVDVEGEDWSGNVELTVTPSITLDYAICYNVKDKENHFKCVVSPTLDCDFDSNWKVSKAVSIPKDPNKPKEFVSVKIPTKVPGLAAKIGASCFLDLNCSAELDVKVPLRIQANAGYDSWRKNENKDPFFVNFDGTGIRTIDGVSDGRFNVKLDGSLYTGLWLNFTVFFLHEDIANAKIGLKAGPKFSATIDYNNDMTHAPSWYDLKDTKISIEPLVAQLTASVKTLFTETLPWSSPQASIFGSKDFYLFPNFTAPHLNPIGSNLSLTALTTDISRNLIFKVTPGIGLYQNNQLKYTYFSDSTYKRQDKWNIENLQMELLNNYPMGDYTAKPVFKFFNNTIEALPSSSVTIPETINVDPESWDFGRVPRNITSSNKAFTVSTNTSGSLSMTKTGDTSMFNVDRTSVSNGESFNVTYKPTDPGTHTMTITLSDGNVSKSVTVTGTCVVPIITVSKDNLDFSTVNVGETKSMSFKVTGTDVVGNIALTLNYTGDKANVTMEPKTYILPATGGTVRVTVNGLEPGNFSGNVKVSASGATTKTVSFSGTVVNTISVTPTSHDFGTVPLNITSDKQAFTVSTSASGTLTVSKKSGDTGMFKIENTSVANGGKFYVSYKPTEVGEHSMIISVSDGTTSKEVTVTGTGVQPTITVNPASLNFENVTVGTSKTLSFKVTGTDVVGNIALTLNYTGDKANVTMEPTTYILPATGGTVKVTVKGLEPGTFSGNVKVSASGATTQTVSFSGTVPTPTINVNPPSLTFTNVGVGTINRKTFTVTGSNLTGELTVMASGNNYYSVSPTTITPTNGTVNQEVTVTYSPQAKGTHSGTVTVSGGGATSKTVSLSGTAILGGGGDV